MKRSVKLDDGMNRKHYDIIACAEANDLVGVKAAVEFDPSSVNEQHAVFGYTAMHVAASQGLDDIFEFLIVCVGLDLSIPDQQGRTAIDEAITCGQHKYLNRMYAHAYPRVVADRGNPFSPHRPFGRKPSP